MGNNQSSHHNRLSKPKTNSNSPYLVPSPDSPVSTIPQYASLSAKDRQVLKSQLTSPIETDFGSRDSSGGDDKLGEIATQVQRRLSTLSRSNSLSCFGGAKNSTTKLASLPGSKLSLVTNTQGVDLDTALKILQEVKRNASPEDLTALHQALQPSPSPVLASENGTDHDRGASVFNRSSSSLIRRRSLVATPGLATRHSPVEGNRRTWNSWKVPHLQLHEEPKWKVEMMGSSPLTRLAALDLAEDGRDSPTPRAQTPGDLDYSHLGSLKLGSLRVTNGAASPSPSAKTISLRRSNPNLSQEEDYFTASEGCSSPVMMQPKRRGHSSSKSSLLHTNVPQRQSLRLPDSARRLKPTSRCDSPLKFQRHGFLTPDDGESGPMKMRLRVMNKSAETIARSYRDEILLSPFETSKTTSLSDQDEGLADFLSDDAMSFREEALRILDGTIFNEPLVITEMSKPLPDPTTSFHDIPNRKKRRNKSRRRSKPRKTDSGYSSGGSCGTRHRESMDQGPAPALSEKPSAVVNILKSEHSSDSDDATSLYTFEQMLALPISWKPLPPLPAGEDVKPRPASLKMPGIGVSHTDDSPMVLSTGTPVSVASQFTTDSKASMQKRLQKRRESHPELPVVQSCQPIQDGTIPSIPKNIHAKFVRRLSELPAMECLTQTYVSKDHISSVESEFDSPPPIVPIEFPSPSPSPTPEERGRGRSPSERPPTPPPHGIRRSLSLFRRKSTVEKRQSGNYGDENSSRNVVDLGTVATALGRSPYDIAMSNVPQKPILSPTHPHQLGDALPRAKSMVNMDSQSAAEFARMRSKDRNLQRPEIPQRPKSYHETNLDAREGTAFKRRPHSIYTEAPPVPKVAANRSSTGYSSVHRVEQQAEQVCPEAKQEPSFRARSTGRGPLVSQLIDKYDNYDNYDQKTPQQQPDWDSHARLWNQRRKSIGEGLRQRASDPRLSPLAISQRASSQPPEDMMVVDRCSGGLDYGYEHGYGIGGSAGTRQLHSYASRRSMHFSNRYGVDLFDVPVFAQRA